MTATPLQARAGERLNLCTVSFNAPDEVAVFKARLPETDFRVLDLSPRPLLRSSLGNVNAVPAGPPSLTNGDWLPSLCRDDMRCDVLVMSAEFAGRFFGTSGRSLSLQEMEEASCLRSCQGLFHSPREVFLLACNTLATKDPDRRTPEQYLDVLLAHGFDRAAAERAVAFRYGPLGPSFREALRRIFAGVPRIYGFDSVGPNAAYSARSLERYFDVKGDYKRYLERTGRAETPNRELLTAYRDTDVSQTSGIGRSARASRDRAEICSLYDEKTSVSARLRTVQRLLDRSDFLAFLPSIEVFMRRHPAARFNADERRLFDEIRARRKARDEVLALVRGLDVCALQMELASLAVQFQWMDKPEFRRIALEGTKKLLTEPVSTETVDIMCEISRHEKVGDVFTSNDIAAAFFESAEGIRFVDCLAPVDRKVGPRLLPPLDSHDATTRLWAAYALSHRTDLSEGDLIRIASHLNDPAPAVRQQLRWLMYARAKTLTRPVRRTVAQHDPELAKALPPQPLPAGGATRPRR